MTVEIYYLWQVPTRGKIISTKRTVAWVTWPILWN